MSNKTPNDRFKVDHERLRRELKAANIPNKDIVIIEGVKRLDPFGKIANK